jgi:type II restriction enzyme
VLDHSSFEELIRSYTSDPNSVYSTWFTSNPGRLKAFRSIRRGVQQVIADVDAGVFGNDFRGSSLETVLNAITEQREVFEGAAHPFYWKPKLRIPDIYESDANKRAFADFLRRCVDCDRPEEILRAIDTLNARSIKGLGPAVANILYFLSPTEFPAFNTAIVRGYNALFGESRKLGSWREYLAMRDTILAINERYMSLLSKDLGAVAGLLYAIGTGELVIEGNAEAVIRSEQAKIDKLRAKRQEVLLQDKDEERSHSYMQYLLLRIGRSLGYSVWVASNDRTRVWAGVPFSRLSIDILPTASLSEDVRRTIELIDVLWLDATEARMVAAFEVEKSTSIYSGILRLADLALTMPDQAIHLSLVAPDNREKDILAQLARPSLSRTPQISYVLFSELECNCDAICKFGSSLEALKKITKVPLF